ncbi:S24/S26 family peptidase [Sulfolobus acidocaldarius]|uniref:Membrane protein n=4 Tax=Sulfolobus acidocaldarius TaxID=2285 RepID=Q4J7Y0_SULAC|nr:S24/S26 family peptidase [Sulfolobus acidocaldarius]AAY81101.1 membrane protein [Sulfolobus acidocaldarius DSM 639]AGE71707.1 membrane protein [Sulfolobus acidocaldarius N8]AGE73980.1 membrane protein [Sulfolobus acidocaldarius Ron12/I]ALU30087.1 hypothetical protein ATY89_09160 [Sulfolobus acidocaldarius]ALU30777.1 hypothetical protein ATZ20_00570 [Sulfolobus acidocaldarius]
MSPNIIFSFYSLKVLKIIGKVFALIVLIFSIFLTFTNLMGRPTFVAITYGYSMFPYLKPGDVAITIPEPVAGKITNGSIVVIKDPDYGVLPGYPPYIIHQVINVLPNGSFVTKGINDNFVDQIYMPPVTVSNIYAKLLVINNNPVVIPYLGEILNSARLNLIPSVGMLALLGISFAVLDRRNNKSKKRRKINNSEYVNLKIVVFFLSIFVFSVFVIMASAQTSNTTVVYLVSRTPGYLYGGTLQSSSVNLGVLLYNQTKSYVFNITNRLEIPEIVTVNLQGDGNESYNVTPSHSFILYPGQEKSINLTVKSVGNQGLHELLVEAFVIPTLFPLSLNVVSPILSLFLYSILNTFLVLIVISLLISRVRV